VPKRDDQLFFIHVMKTGGTTLVRNALQNVPADQVFPRPLDEPDPVIQILTYMAVSPFAALDAEQRAHLRWLSAHVPLSVAETDCPEARTVLLLRDPVERTLSYLRHCQQRHPEHADLPMEAIYEDEWFYVRFIQDHQTKMLSMTYEEATAEQLRDEPPELLERMRHDPALFEEVTQGWLSEGAAKTLLSVSDRTPTERVVVDDRRLDVASDALERVDLVALTPQLGQLLDLMSARYGWTTTPMRLNASERSEPASDAFRARIAADNAADVELYRRAEARCASGPSLR
jgi:hypothetical protein